MADKEVKTSDKQNEKQEVQTRENARGKDMARRSQPGDRSHYWHDPFLMSPREFFSANPFSLMRRMTEEIDRAFGGLGFDRSLGGGGNTWAPPIEVAERDGNYVVRAELPGIQPDDVKVEVTDDALIVQGERKSEHDENKGGVHRTEHHYGQFYRSVQLPEGVNAEQVQANFDNGVLEVKIPVPQHQSHRRQIPVHAHSGTAVGAGQSKT
jgi:HSP20 family protein